MVTGGQAYGNMYEGTIFFASPNKFQLGIACPLNNTGWFAETLHQANILHHFFGHDHCDDFQGSYKNIHFHFGRKTGFGGYHCQFLKQGARVIKISENPSPSPNAPLYTLTSSIMTYD